MQNKHRDIEEYVCAHSKTYETLLRRLVDINSSTEYKIGVDTVGSIVCEFLQRTGLNIFTYEHNDKGNLIIASHPDVAENGPRVLLSCHTDMVVQQKDHIPFSKTRQRYYGSGISDMKAGVAIVLATLKYFSRRNISGSLVASFTPDEEMGSQTYKNVLDALYAEHNYALVFEPSNPKPPYVQGSGFHGIVNRRKGILFYRIETLGVQAHAGVVEKKSQRKSAISELVAKLQQVQLLEDYEKGTTVNVGVIGGGVSHNTIAPEAYAEVDVRFWSQDEMKRIVHEIERIFCKPTIQGTHTEVDLASSRPSLELSDKSKVFR